MYFVGIWEKIDCTALCIQRWPGDIGVFCRGGGGGGGGGGHLVLYCATILLQYDNTKKSTGKFKLVLWDVHIAAHQ